MKEKIVRGRINSLMNDQGILITDPQEIQKLILPFYTLLLGNRASVLQGVDREVVNKGPLLFHDLCLQLIQPVSKQEIDEALFSIHIYKAPGQRTCYEELCV